MGLAVTYVGQIERGQRNPSLRVIEQFADVFGVDALSLLTPALSDGGEQTNSEEEA